MAPLARHIESVITTGLISFRFALDILFIHIMINIQAQVIHIRFLYYHDRLIEIICNVLLVKIQNITANLSYAMMCNLTKRTYVSSINQYTSCVSTQVINNMYRSVGR